MSGERILLDTNAVIALLQGHDQLANRLAAADWIGISVMTWMEFMSFPELSAEDAQLFVEACSRLEVVGLTIDDRRLLELVVKVRSENQLKMPDAIIVGTAIYRDAILLTQDRQLLGSRGGIVQEF